MFSQGIPPDWNRDMDSLGSVCCRLGCFDLEKGPKAAAKYEVPMVSYSLCIRQELQLAGESETSS